MSRRGHEPLDVTERELARRLAQLDATAAPSPALDAAVLAAARADQAGSGAPPQAAPTRMRRRPRRWPVGLGIAASLAVAVGLAWQLRPLPETGAVPTPTEAGPLQVMVPGEPQDSLGDAARPPMAGMAMPAPADTPAERLDAAPATPQARRAPPASEVTQEAAPAPARPPAATPGAQAPAAPKADTAREPRIDPPTAARAATAQAQAQEQAARARAAQARDAEPRARAAAPATAVQAAIARDRAIAPSPIPPAPPAPPAASMPAPKTPAPPAPAPAESGFVPPPPPAAAVFHDRESGVQLHLQQPAAPTEPFAESSTTDAVDAFADQPFDEQPPASADSPAVRDAWLQRIRELREAGRPGEARASLREFVRRHPQAAVPDDLRPLLEE